MAPVIGRVRSGRAGCLVRNLGGLNEKKEGFDVNSGRFV